ncbi:RNA polymerase sigma factor [Microbacterium sp.]|uniref:RNA polymerase sigma factor n=1 Tax=Microbacterium sp. TaxID=51671 RepID=UPI003A84F723
MNENVEQYRALFLSSYNTILRFVERRVSAREDAAELAADVFRIAWQKYDPGQANSRSWLFTIARNVVLEHYRRTARRNAATQRLIEATELAGAPFMDDDGTEHPVIAALQQLPERMQEVLRLRYWDELEIGEIATVLGISQGATRVQLHRARARIRELLPAPLVRKGDA